MRNNLKYLSADQRRAATIEAVVQLAAEQNPGDITTAAIAQKMNLTQGALFRHFPTKEAIWQAVMGWVTERLLARLDDAARSAGTPLAALEAMFLAHIDFVVDHPGVPRMLFGELQRPDDSPVKAIARDVMRRYRERLARLIEEGKAAGELSPHVDTAAAAVLFLGTIQGLVMQGLLAGDPRRMHQEGRNVWVVYRRAIEEAQ